MGPILPASTCLKSIFPSAWAATAETSTSSALLSSSPTPRRGAGSRCLPSVSRRSAAIPAIAGSRREALAQTKKDQKPQPASAKPVVMIDPGHGGIDRGAMVKGLVEKELVFDFAKAVAAKLETDGRFKVVMTRDDDSFVPLSERVRMARDGNAALFVSIHADTLSEASDVSGATVYTVSDRASDA